MRYFLVDFENVADTGMNGFFDLPADDTVDVFYTQKNNRISMDFFTSFLEREHAAVLRLRKVASGNQALDLQLASYLGSLIAGGREDCEYCIISKDKGFACLPAFWENQKGKGTVRLAGSIREAVTERPEPAQPAAPPAPPAQPVKAAIPAQPGATHKKAAPPAPAVKAAPPAGSHSKLAPKSAAPVEPAISAEPAPPAKAETEPAAPEAAAPVETAAEGDKAKTAPQPNEKTILNVKVQQVLSKAKCDTQVISQTASTVAKAYGDPKIKQIVYRDLIKRYGQKQGLEVYDLVKPLLK